ncbi:SPRY domain-containing protein [Paenibacillus dendritiformis]
MGIIDVTWDAVNKGSGVILSNGNLTAKVPNYNNTVRATHGKSHGKWYWEITISVYNWLLIGIANKNAHLNTNNSETQNIRYYRDNGLKHPEATPYGANFDVDDTISILLDLDNGTLEFWKNGVSQGVSHTNIKLMGEVYPSITAVQSVNKESTVTANFGATPFKYSPPAGFKPYDVDAVNNKLLLSNSLYHLSLVSNQYTYFKPLLVTASSTWSSIYHPMYLIDDDLTTAWCSYGNTGSLVYDFGTPKTITKYSITSWADYLARAPKTWSVSGSDDNVNWTILDSRSNITNWSSRIVQEFQINAIGSFQYYKFDITENNGDSWLAFLELATYETRLDTLIRIYGETTEELFSKYGMKSLDSLTNHYSAYTNIQQRSYPLNEGKTFEHAIDLKKYEVNKISLGITS